MHELIKEKTIYGITFKVIEDNIKVDKDFQIPLIEDRAFRYICHVYPKVIIKFLAGVCNIDENLIESAYFVDTSIPDLRFNDKKIDALIYLLISRQKNILI
mgnify:CR=1 FL=1